MQKASYGNHVFRNYFIRIVFKYVQRDNDQISVNPCCGMEVIYSVFKLKLKHKNYVVVKRLVVVLLVMFAFEVYSEDEKEVVVRSADQFKHI